MTESPQAHRKDEHLSLGVSLWRDTTPKNKLVLPLMIFVGYQTLFLK